MSADAGWPATVPGEHVVHFYARDDEVVDGVGSLLGAALASGEPVVVVATAEHRRGFEERMAAAGADIPAARSSGNLVTLDAAQTMNRFVISNRPDRDDFERVVGGRISQITGKGRPVHVYGEMVALLVGAGQADAALELEALWNGLAARLPFSLVCGYSVQSVAAAGLARSMKEICSLHSAVTGPAEAARSFEMASDAPRDARHFVVETLREWGDCALADDAAMIATELATNAIRHARSGFTTTVSLSADGVRIAIRDDGAVPGGDGGQPMVMTAGHGLWVVDAVASRWAVDPTPGGKTVWAEIS